MRTPFFVAAALLTACHGGTIFLPSGTVECSSTPTGEVLDVSETSTLGFSALDVLAAIEGTHAVTTVSGADGSVLVRDIEFTFVPGQQAEVELREAQTEPTSCVTGDTLAFDADLTVTSADGWFSGTGPVTIAAHGTDPGQIWVSASFEVTGSLELETEAKSYNPSSCDPADLVIKYVHGSFVHQPWSDHLGGVEVVTCDYVGTLYNLDPS